MRRSPWSPVLLAVGLLLAAPCRGAAPSTVLCEVYTARMLNQLKGWVARFAEKQGETPASIQHLIRQMPAPERGIAWLWLVDRKMSWDYDFELDFVTGGWAVAARPKRSDSSLSLFLASDPQQPLQGGDAGGRIGNSALPVLDLLRLERRMDAFVDGPRDIDALMRGLTVIDAQTVMLLKNGAYACSAEELDAARAAGQRVLPADLFKSDEYFDYQLEGVKDAGGRCTAWVFRARNLLEAFPMYEVGSDRAIWVVPTWGPRKGLRIALDEWDRSKIRSQR